jgi:hypothetical protein
MKKTGVLLFFIFFIGICAAKLKLSLIIISVEGDYSGFLSKVKEQLKRN